MRKALILAVGMSVIAGAAQANDLLGNYRSGYGLSGASGAGSNPGSHQTRGYTTQSGAYVQPHYRTNPNNTPMDNYSTRGNVNPYTGNVGTRSPYR